MSLTVASTSDPSGEALKKGDDRFCWCFEVGTDAFDSAVFDPVAPVLESLLVIRSQDSMLEC